MIKLNALAFLISHSICMLLFGILYYYLMKNVDKHFVINSKVNKTNKLLNTIYYTTGVQSTNGSDIQPISYEARTITSLQYISTILITIGAFTYL